MKPKYHTAKSILAPLARLNEDGFNAAQALAGTGLSLAVLTRPEERVGLGQELQFLRNLRKITGSPTIGLYVGECYPLSVFGLYGYAIMSASTVGEALKIAYGYVELSLAYFEHSLRLRGGQVVMTMSSDDYQDSDIGMLTEREMMATFMILRGILGEDVKLIRASFRHAAMASKLEYSAKFGCDVEFSQLENALIFDAELLNKPLMQCDSGTANLCLERCQRLKAQMSQHSNIVNEVNEILMLRPGQFPSIEEVAGQFNMSSRTLRRRLGEQGLGYREIVDKHRYSLAQEYLSTTDISIQQIAMLLGYSDTAHFSNAYKRWDGQSPANYRTYSFGSAGSSI